ncbi:MAG: hypothetical protein NT080_12755 [Spirochaetes bacterium]|nr:hypothetical protein [Spirochaetota bacterium]
MNTIPTTLDAHRVSYTIVGGGKGKTGGRGVPVSVVVLGRGGRLHRAELLRELERVGFDSILSVEKAGESVEVEAIATGQPTVRHLLLEEDASEGERVNIGIRESPAPYVFVLRDDMKLTTSTLSSRFFERLTEKARLCTTPVVTTRKGEAVPTIIIPAMREDSIKFLLVPASRDEEKNAAPFDFCGIYNRGKFAMLGGYDWTIRAPHWQKLDFGMRAWLWGEEIRSAQALKLICEREPPAEDITLDAHYSRFYLKNLAVSLKGDQGVLPLSRAAGFIFKSGLGPFRALSEFAAVRKWVKINRFRFRTDARGLVDLWEPLSS